MTLKRKENGGEYKINTALTYRGVLDEIAANLESIDQWAKTGHYRIAHEREIAAETLISLLEVNNCGSIGGFDKNQPSGQNLLERWKWLEKQYNKNK